jgi:hypothetical protein
MCAYITGRHGPHQMRTHINKYEDETNSRRSKPSSRSYQMRTHINKYEDETNRHGA